MRDRRSVRVGVLGAARIVRDALVRPARGLDGIAVAAIAARDPDRAAAYARRHGIPTTHRTYEDLLADPALDAVYVPLPAALHERWTLAAIEAGKHVLCEKPFASNAIAAARVAARAATAPTVVMEAYHSRYHPFHERLREVIASGELGRIESAAAHFHAPIPPGRDIRWNLALGGGGLLDVGYYPLRMLRELVGEVVSVDRAIARGSEIDRSLDATLMLAGSVRAELRCSMWSRRFLGMGFAVAGTRGSMRVSFPYHPHLGAVARIRAAGERRVERADRSVSTYASQLAAFRDAARFGEGVPTDAAAAVPHLAAVDALYHAVGMSPRPSMGADSKA